MEVKCLEVRDDGTFMPIICIRPTPDNEAQRYLLMRDGYRGDDSERCIIFIDVQCHGVAYDPYEWNVSMHGRTKLIAHDYITRNWASLKDGDVVDIEFIRGERPAPKASERETVTI